MPVLALYQIEISNGTTVLAMGAFLFRCPNTGQHVHGWAAEEVDASDDQYDGITCTACQAVHFVNPATGKVAGAPTE